VSDSREKKPPFQGLSYRRRANALRYPLIGKRLAFIANGKIERGQFYAGQDAQYRRRSLSVIRPAAFSFWSLFFVACGLPSK
jgi:hypothetical protein